MKGGSGADKFQGLWPNTSEHFTKVKLGDGSGNVNNKSGSVGFNLGTANGSNDDNDRDNNNSRGGVLSGDPAAPDPWHPHLAADYRKPGSAVMGVALQSNITHPLQLLSADQKQQHEQRDGGGEGIAAVRAQRRRDAAARRAERYKASEVGVKGGFEHQTPKVYYSSHSGLAFSSRAELKRYERTMTQFGEYERYSHTPQIGRDQPRSLEDGGPLAVAKADAEALMATTGQLSGFQVQHRQLQGDDDAALQTQDRYAYGDDGNEAYNNGHLPKVPLHSSMPLPATSPLSTTTNSAVGAGRGGRRRQQQQKGAPGTAVASLQSQSVKLPPAKGASPRISSNSGGYSSGGKGATGMKNKSRRTTGAQRGGDGGQKLAAKSSLKLSMGGLSLSNRLQSELEELAAVAQATAAMSLRPAQKAQQSMRPDAKTTSAISAASTRLAITPAGQPPRALYVEEPTTGAATATMRTTRPRQSSREASSAPEQQQQAAGTVSKHGATTSAAGGRRFQGDSRGASASHVRQRQWDNGSFMPSRGASGPLLGSQVNGAPSPLSLAIATANDRVASGNTLPRRNRSLSPSSDEFELLHGSSSGDDELGSGDERRRRTAMSSRADSRHSGGSSVRSGSRSPESQERRSSSPSQIGTAGSSNSRRHLALSRGANNGSNGSSNGSDDSPGKPGSPFVRSLSRQLSTSGASRPATVKEERPEEREEREELDEGGERHGVDGSEDDSTLGGPPKTPGAALWVGLDESGTICVELSVPRQRDVITGLNVETRAQRGKPAVVVRAGFTLAAMQANKDEDRTRLEPSNGTIPVGAVAAASSAAVASTDNSPLGLSNNGWGRAAAAVIGALELERNLLQPLLWMHDLRGAEQAAMVARLLDFLEDERRADFAFLSADDDDDDDDNNGGAEEEKVNHGLSFSKFEAAAGRDGSGLAPKPRRVSLPDVHDRRPQNNSAANSTSSNVEPNSAVGTAASTTSNNDGGSRPHSQGSLRSFFDGDDVGTSFDWDTFDVSGQQQPPPQSRPQSSSENARDYDNDGKFNQAYAVTSSVPLLNLQHTTQQQRRRRRPRHSDRYDDSEYAVESGRQESSRGSSGRRTSASESYSIQPTTTRSSSSAVLEFTYISAAHSPASSVNGSTSEPRQSVLYYPSEIEEDPARDEIIATAAAAPDPDSTLAQQSPLTEQGQVHGKKVDNATVSSSSGGLSSDADFKVSDKKKLGIQGNDSETTLAELRMEVLPGRYYSSDEESEDNDVARLSSSRRNSARLKGHRRDSSLKSDANKRPGTAGSSNGVIHGPTTSSRPTSPGSSKSLPAAQLSAEGAADAVRASLMEGEVAAALVAEDVEALVELLAIAKAASGGSTAIKVLEGMTRLLSAAASAASEAKQASEAADAREDAAAERERNVRLLAQGLPPMDARARRNFLDDLSKKRATARQYEATRNAKNRRRVRSVGEQFRAAGLVEGCVDAMQARSQQPPVLIAVANCLAALASGDELNVLEQKRVLYDSGVGAALAAAVRAHGSAEAAAASAAAAASPKKKASRRQSMAVLGMAHEPPPVPTAAMVETAHALRDAVRAASGALGLGAAVEAQLPGPGIEAVEGQEAVDPITALLREKRFMTTEELRKAM